MRPRVIIFKDLENKLKKQNKIIELCKLDTDDRVEFINVHDSDIKSLKLDLDPLVYFMGGTELKKYAAWDKWDAVGYGPSFDQLADSMCRDTLKMHLEVGGKDNAFDKYEKVNYINAASLLEEDPPLKLSAIPRKTEIPKIEGHIDDAITAIQYLKLENIPVALPELNTFISGESTSNSLSYDELIAILLVFKRLGAENLYWKDKVVFKNEDTK